jgi:hypothetical protein
MARELDASQRMIEAAGAFLADAQREAKG